MASERLVVIGYSVDEEFAGINTRVLGDAASIAFLRRFPKGERMEVLSRAEALISWDLRRELPVGALQQARALRFIQLLSAGADTVDFAEVPEQAVLASNVGAYAAPMAEHVMAMALGLAKRLTQQDAALASGRFDTNALSRTLNGAVCAILGFGGIGKATARLMQAFGASIYAVNTTGQTSEPVEFAGTLANLDQVLAVADVLIIALPLNTATHGLLGPRELALMKPDAMLVNVARGAIIDERALYEHLQANPEFLVAIDAWWGEPSADGTFRTSYPFLELPNVIGSPHNSGMVPGIRQFAARRGAQNVLRWLWDEPVVGLVRREDYPPARSLAGG
jgi:phosphoglycerate dehydrogenase-like enzyme